MATNTQDWPGIGHNPAPGEPGAVSGLSTSLRRVSQHLVEVHTVLTQLSNGQGQWTGEAANAFTGKLGKLPGYLRDASDSITEAYQALDVWYRSLGEHQPKARDLERQARSAREHKEQAEAAHRSAAGAADLQLAGKHYPDDASLADAKRRYDAARTQLDAAARTVDSAATELDDVLRRAHELGDTHKSDARQASTRIRQAADSKAPPEPGMFSKIGSWIKAHGADMLTVAASVAGVAAIFFPPLALAAIALSAGAFAAHVATYGASGLWPPSSKNVGNYLTLGGDLLGAIPGVGVAAKGIGVAGRTARATEGVGAGIRAGAKAGATEVRAGARAIDPANPIFTTAIEKPAMKLGLSKAAAMNVSDGVQAATTLGLAAPTAYSLTQNNPSDGLTSSVNYTTGAGNVLGGAGMARGGGKAGVAGSLLALGSAFGLGNWGVAHGH
ncbi:putative T7SS-secreted protein [Kitasatospora sp. NPDC050543]|uniref:putative T7SS-secreted protein n=1 Tax=Kitasatospora sp. NPDC050543 TaxID=3364054 RepID=UPI0037BCB922